MNVVYYVDTPPPSAVQTKFTSNSSFQHYARYPQVLRDSSVVLQPGPRLVSGITPVRPPLPTQWPTQLHETYSNTQLQYLVQPGALNGSSALSLRHIGPWKASRTVRCTSCDITLNSQQQARQHYSGKAHQRRLQKLQQRQQEEPRTPDAEIGTTTTESRDAESKQNTDAARLSSGVDDVVSEQPDTDAVSKTTTLDGEFSRSIAGRQRDDQMTRLGDDDIENRGKKRTSFDVERRSNNKCFRGGLSTSDDDIAADDNGGMARCGAESLVEVFSGADEAQTEISSINTRTPTRLTAEVNQLAAEQLPTNMLCSSVSPTADAVTLSSNVYKTADFVTDDVTLMQSKLPLPVTSSSSYSEGPNSSGSIYSNIADTANTCCNDRVTDDVTPTFSKQFPVLSSTTRTACSATTTFVSSETSPVGTVGLFPRELTPTRVGGVLHSVAGLFPFPVPMTISKKAPFVVGCSTMTVRPSTVSLGTPHWLPIPQATASPQYPPLRLIPPTAIPTGYFRKPHVTGSYGPSSPQIGYYIAMSSDRRYLSESDFVLQPNSAEVAPQVSDASQPPRLLPRLSSVDPPQRVPTSKSSQQVFVDHESTVPSEEVIAKLDPVSRAVYDNFLGKLRATTRPKTRTGRLRGHVNDVTRRYRN